MDRWILSDLQKLIQTARRAFQEYNAQAFCLEADHFPDSVNHPDFPSTILEPGKTYTATTIYKFSAAK